MKETAKKVIIIGAGVSGISAGIYAQKNGFISEIYEKNHNPGGLCMCWTRNDTLVDGCIHWLTGTREGTQLNEMWKDVGAFNQDDIIHPEAFGSVEYKGQVVTFWTDLNKFEQQLLEISPEDEKEIKRLIKLIIKIQNMPLPMDAPTDCMDIFRLTQVGVNLLPYLPMYLYTFHQSCEMYAKRFKSPVIRYALTHIIPGKNNLYGTLYAYGTNCVKNGGVKRGGSFSLIERMVDEYHNQGGYINYNSEIKEIIVEKNKAVGIELKNGKKVYADYIVSACDAYHVLNTLLKDNYLDPRFAKRFKNPVLYTTPSSVYVSFSVNLNKLTALGLPTHTYEFETEEYRVGNSYHNTIKIRDYSYDSTFIEGDNCYMNVMIPQDDFDFTFWEKLRNNYTLYRKEKNRIGQMIIDKIVAKYPTLEGAIKLIDVSTPMTYNRYCNTYRGSYMPFGLDYRGSMLMHNGRIKGLKNLYMAGQWMQMPGGIPLALMTGKFAIQRILKKEHKLFKITSKSFVIYHK